MNYAINQGPMSTSDHFPIIITLSTSPIMIPQKESINVKRANWDLFKSNLEENMNNDYNENEIITKEVVDRHLEDWFEKVENAIEIAIPKKTYLTLPHPLTSNNLKNLQWRYKNILNIVEYLGWTPLLRTQYKQLQEELKEESKLLYIQHWNKLVEDTEIEYNNPKKFWSRIKRLLGTKLPSIPYLLDERNNKVFDNKEKERIFRSFWENIFKISPEDNQNFDRQHEILVESFINENQDRVKPYPSANMERLDINNPLIRPIEEWEIKAIIKNFKNKAPGNSGIKKIIMQNLPDVAIRKLKDIYNWALSMGYFPILFKDAILILIPKDGKDSKLKEN